MSYLTKKEFIEEITALNYSQGEAVQQLKKKEYPLVLWGKGNYATSILRILEQQDIHVEAVCVDTEFYNGCDSVWEGIKVYSTDEISKVLSPFNIVVGFADFRAAEKKIKYITGCRNSFFLDNFHNIFDHSYILENIEQFYNTYSLLQDELSKKILRAFIKTKITGYPDDLYDLVDFNQYFPKDIVKLKSNEVFIDAGAFTGDTITKFNDEVNGSYKAIYAFEPGEITFEKLAGTVENLKLKNVNLYRKGVWNQKASLKFQTNTLNAARSAVSDKGTITVEVDSIDNVMNGEEVTFIKMDIEGAEYEALRGAEKTIRKYKPKMAICAYHKQDDLFTIPQYIKSLNPEYKLYLRQHLYISQELVLYAL